MAPGLCCCFFRCAASITIDRSFRRVSSRSTGLRRAPTTPHTTQNTPNQLSTRSKQHRGRPRAIFDPRSRSVFFFDRERAFFSSPKQICLRPSPRSIPITMTKIRKKRSPPASTFKGLAWDKHEACWRVRVSLQGKQHHLGRCVLFAPPPCSSSLQSGGKVIDAAFHPSTFLPQPPPAYILTSPSTMAHPNPHTTTTTIKTHAGTTTSSMPRRCTTAPR